MTPLDLERFLRPKTTVLTVTGIDPELKTWLGRYAKSTGHSMSAVVVALLKNLRAEHDNGLQHRP